MNEQINLSLPSSWADIPPKKLVRVSRWFTSGLTRQALLIRALILFTNLVPLRRVPWFDRAEQRQYHWFKLHGQKHLISDGDIHTASKRLEFLLDAVTECNPPRILWKRPNHRLYSTRFESYLMAENYFAAFESTGKTKYLNRLSAVVLMSRYSSKKEMLFSAVIHLVPKPRKYAIYMWYSGFRWYCKERCPHLFRIDPNAEETEFRDHILNMVRCLNKGDITRNKALMKAKTWDALDELEATCKVNLELKKKYNV